MTDTPAVAVQPPYGLRGWLLLLWGSVWVTWGLALTAYPADRAANPLYDVVTRYLPLMTWGWVWCAVGAIGALCGALRRHGLGFKVLSFMPAGWGIGLAASYFTAGSPSGLPLGYTFFAIGACIALTSGMEDARLLLRRGAA